MILIDVNILVYAKRQDAPDHLQFHAWLEKTLRSDTMVGLSEVVLSGVIRVLTHPRIQREPTHLDEALEYANYLRSETGCIIVSPGSQHWKIFTGLCKSSGAKGNLVSDAFHAALAIESGAEWITADRDYAKFPGLRWRHPLA